MTRWVYAAFAVLFGAAVVAVVLVTTGGDEETWVTVPMKVEYSEEDGSPIPEDEQPTRGTVRALRLPDRIEAEFEMTGLVPDGVYSYWLAVWQDTDEAGERSFLTSGGGAVAGEDGELYGRMGADLGDESITGWILDGGPVVFAPLHSPLDDTMRVEVVYHGQRDRAGDDLDAWLSDFWTGDPEVCAHPVGTQGTGFVPSLPYCAGFYGASVPPVAPLTE